ncbi:MAG TPA: hypothetical protein VMU65_01110 [Candidatus Saccharimonadales bacterium]|nr:hypothetical protein [Candidatus Saccharimonadales bacterium]
MNTMLIHDFAYVPVAAARVRDRILANHGEWLGPLAAAAAGAGEALRLRIGPLEALPMLGKTVTVHVGQPIARGEVTVVPLTWQATNAPGLFPVLSADLEVAALGEDLTQLTLQGRYDPPLGAVGQRIDRLLMHRVAEASVRSFLGHLAERLSALEDVSSGILG